MNTRPYLLYFSFAVTGIASAHTINSAVDADTTPPFDITAASATTDGRLATFTMGLESAAGSVKPEPIGQLPGAKIESYVWPTSLNPSTVGFDADSGILALAITAHPDFDDTPLYDEDLDGDPANDGANWHSHWIVLTEDNTCGAGLKVRDVSLGKDLLPVTAPRLPIALDSPGMSPLFSDSVLRLTVPISEATGVSFDAVTAELQVNETGDEPMLCVTVVHDIASGDLSLPGRIVLQK